MKFTFNKHLIAQIFLTILQGLNWLNANVPTILPFLPPKDAPIVASVLTLIQAILGLTAHFYTPAGDKIQK